MQGREVGQISQYISNHTGETRGLSDWCQDINSQNLIRRRLTRRELAFIFNRHLKNGPLQIEHSTCPVQYTFFRMEIQTAVSSR